MSLCRIENLACMRAAAFPPLDHFRGGNSRKVAWLPASEEEDDCITHIGVPKCKRLPHSFLKVNLSG